MNQIFTINSRKFDGKIHRSWSAKLKDQNSSVMTFVGIFEHDVNHKDLGVIRRGTISYEYYWLDRWYNIFQFHEPEGDLRNFYCNICQPPIFNENSLDYIDYDIDILVWKDFSYHILDMEEFEENKRALNYPKDIIRKIHNSVSEIEILIEKREFPFDIKNL